ncbi:GlxA family transcriptional regulator [Burkholderia sp. WSM2230]|uniref:GlxA family transcriptional regulator n=1 Tax=Burkholderia sp. WSM2230 TaxID=944435 RepID=UPI0004147711|nr:helix-turn-helix domain-containing protein [Burkholderia sp. WSM2230]
MGPRSDQANENALETHSSTHEGSARHIGVALFNGFALPDVASIIEVFQSANALGDPEQSGRPHYEVSLLSASGGRIASSSSVFIWTDGVASLRRTDNFHALFIAGGIGATTAFRDDRLIVWLRRVFPASTLVHAIAEGKLLLDAAGVTATRSERTGRQHDTHARAASRAIDHSLSPLQVALRIVEADIGAEIARQVAEWVAPRQKLATDANIRATPTPHVSEQIQASARWLEANGTRPVSIEAVAQIAAMSERNFLRRFKSEMGVTPSDYLLQVRLEMSCKLLANTSLPVDKIARRCGIGSGGRLAKLFRKHLSTTPTEYRMMQQKG